MRNASRPTRYQRPDDRYFRTKNLHLAVVLLARGFPLVNIEQTVPSRSEFVFRTSYELEDIADRFLERKTVLLDAQKLFFSWQLLRTRIERGYF
jgi:hypothetical protein